VKMSIALAMWLTVVGVPGDLETARDCPLFADEESTLVGAPILSPCKLPGEQLQLCR